MTTKVHKVRFYNPKPLGVNCLAYNKPGECIAISREDASIEIWDIKHNPFLVKSIVGFEKGSVEALCWVNQRLISTGLSGALVEWDLEKLTTKWSTLLTGYAAWCLDADCACSMVAVGTEQGYLNLFRVEADQFVYERLFDKQEGRIICCKFDKTGQVLVTGSVAAIRIWDVGSGLCRHKLNAGRRGRETLVWSLAVLADLTVVAGDSHGRLTFWDGNLAEQIESFVTHKADILSVVVSEDEQTLYCSGVDPTIVCFTKLPVHSRREEARVQWVRSVQRQVHEHDVRVLALKGKTLMSLGADGYLAFSSYPPKWLMRVPPQPPAPCIAVALSQAGHKLLLLRYSNHIEVWKLGRYCTSSKGNPVFLDRENIKPPNKPRYKCGGIEEDSGAILQNLHKPSTVLKLEEAPVKLVSIRAKGKRQIRCCAMSPDGQYVVYSTDEDVRVFKLEPGADSEEEASVVRVPVLAPGAPPCDLAVFTADSARLLLVAHGALRVLQLHHTGLTLHQHINTTQYMKNASVLRVACGASGDTTYVACGDSQGGVTVWRGAGAGLLAHHASLPPRAALPAALALDPSADHLLVVYVDNWIVEYNLRSCRLSAWPARVPREWSARRLAVTAAAYHPRAPRRLLLCDHSAVWVLHADHAPQEMNDEPAAKKNVNEKRTRLKYDIIPCKYLVGLAWLSPDEAVLVERSPDHIVSQLPPVLASRKFADA